MSTIYTRDKYNAPPVGVNMARQSTMREAFLHHSDDAEGLSYNTKDEQVAKLRAIDDFHRNSRGWAMGGYHWLVFQRTGTRNFARAYNLRPVEYVPAAQLNHNTNTLAICIVGNGAHETLFADTRELIAQLVRRYPSIRTLGGHRDVVATSCPGDRFYAQVGVIANSAGVRRFH